MCELGYTLFTIHEAVVYLNLEPIFQDFMRMLASRKIRFGKVPPSYKQDLEKYCNDLNHEMGFTKPEDVLRPAILEENSYQQNFIKSVMNIGESNLFDA